MLLTLADHPDGVATTPGNRVVYALARDEAHYGATQIDGHALVWELAGDPGPGEWILRCDRVDFPPGGVAYRHVHPGPGIRRLLFGELTIESLEMVGELTRGSPLCRAVAPGSPADGIEITFKGGQIGDVDFFRTVQSGHTHG